MLNIKKDALVNITYIINGKKQGLYFVKYEEVIIPKDAEDVTITVLK